MTSTVLAFDTSGPYIEATLLHGDAVRTRREDMAKGQAERLIGLLEEVLADGGVTWDALDAVGVGIGPGNFTGIRISVSSARGAALGLGIPAIGVSALEALAEGQSRPVLTSVAAPRDHAYVQVFGAEQADTPRLIALENVQMPDLPETESVIGARAESLSKLLNLKEKQSVYQISVAMARIARRKMAHSNLAPPAPLYIKPADAAPPREAPPRILDDA